MPIQIVDGLGTWDELGTVEPVFEDWLTFPDYTYSNSTLLRLIFSFERFDLNSYGFIRCKYESQNTFAIGRWIRFYPKLEPEIIRYPHPEDIANLKGDFKRIYQVLKRHRQRRFNGTLAATPWSVNLNVSNEPTEANTSNGNTGATFPPTITLGLI